MKYQFYAIVFDVAGNATPVGSSASPDKSFATNIQKVTGISINPSGSVTKNIGENFTISATVSPTDANNKAINWNSSNKAVATIDTNGKVSCLASGTTTITATAADGSGTSASLALTVKNPINSLTLDKDQTTIMKDGFVATVTATTDPANYSDSNISWSIADTSIATLTVSGKTARIKSTSKIGQTTLTVSAGGITKTVKISVVNFVTTTYSYTGTVQQVDLPAGTYKLEVWGAQGGDGSGPTGVHGGYGGYSIGMLSLTTNTTIYVVIGSHGTNGSTGISSGGYNGGGNGGNGGNSYDASGGGGGATHIATRNGVLSTLSSYKSDILIVAGGGGGANEGYSTSNNCANTHGGNGGGYYGHKGENSGHGLAGEAGTQSSGGKGAIENCGKGTGKSGSFGLGGNGGEYSTNSRGGGGGGGFYGGGGGGSGDVESAGPGGGGSGYINTSKLTNAFMYGYNVPTSSATATKTYSTTNVSSTPTSNYAKSGDGAARITPVN